MSTPSLTNVCVVCGAEESLDALLMRMIDDTEVRNLIADVIALSLPVGKDVLRYLRLHKPAKQRLRLTTVRKLLAELVPDIQRLAIERKGRVWVVSGDMWTAAFQAVFDADKRGSLTLPLEGNGYLYGVLTRMADREEGETEREQEKVVRQRVAQPGERTLEDLVTEGLAGQPAAQAAHAALTSQGATPDPEAAEKAALAADIRRRLAADLAARKARQQTAESPE
ncbi:hypothetical protein [Variovorax sp. E3]|uniref:hypothetical protein n=1 Tax=Variovorax sp. E3 TaxID=1914993 RepID=UPI0018DB35E5|nr:hypothetical protein [Variovorax sp. E3]